MSRHHTEGSNIRLTLLHYERIIVDTPPNGKLPFTMCELERDLCQHENTLGKNKHTSRHQQHKTRNNKYSNKKRRHARANNAKHFCKPLKCLKCAGPHRLIDCKKATPEEKEELWKKFSTTFKKKPMYQTHANKATTTPEEKTTTTTKSDTKHPHQAHVTIKSSHNEQRLHWANQASHNSQSFSHMSE